MKKIISWFFILVFAVTLSGCGKKTTTNNQNAPSTNLNQNSATGAPLATPEGQTTIIMKDFAFQPANLTIKKGTIVTWLNNDNASHSIIADPRSGYSELKSLNSYILAPGQSWSFTFDNLGVFGYKCGLHSTMLGLITVVE